MFLAAITGIVACTLCSRQRRSGACLYIPERTLMAYVIFIVAIVLNAVANILMKAGAVPPRQASHITDVLRNMVSNPFIIAGVVCFALGLAAYNYVLIKTDLSVAYPIMTSVGYVIVILAAWLFFKESLTMLQVSGIALIAAGVWMVAR